MYCATKHGEPNPFSFSFSALAPSLTIPLSDSDRGVRRGASGRAGPRLEHQGHQRHSLPLLYARHHQRPLDPRSPCLRQQPRPSLQRYSPVLRPFYLWQEAPRRRSGQGCQGHPLPPRQGEGSPPIPARRPRHRGLARQGQAAAGAGGRVPRDRKLDWLGR